jgi:hypothetical protein
MRFSDFSRHALTGCAAAAILAGCGGSQPPIGAPGAMQQTSTIAIHADRAKSWMLPEAKRRDLLYISNPHLVKIYTYPGNKKVGSLSFPSAFLYGECTDTAADVFVVDHDFGAYEYRHGDTTIVASIYNPASDSLGCSVDPVTGTLAITSISGKKVLSTFRYSANRGWRFAKTYTDAAMKYGHFCSYDNSGNLYVDGTGSSSTDFVLTELPKGNSKLTDISLNQNIGGAGGIQWDGADLTVADSTSSPTEIYQFSMSGSNGTKVGSLELDGSDHVAQFWIQGDILIGPDVLNNKVGFWQYPAGGSEIKTRRFDIPYGATVSLATQQ